MGVFLRALTGLVLLVVLGGCAKVESLKVMAPSMFGMIKIAPKIYVDKQMPAAQRTLLLSAVSDARSRVMEIYGKLDADPTFTACSSETCFASFGGRVEKIKVVGPSNVMLISPRALEPVFMSHEWSHVELHGRIGVIGMKLHRIPDWFDEGLAIFVSRDPRYTDDAWRQATDNGRLAPRLTGPAPARCPEGNSPPCMNSDKTAVHEVRAWYAKAGSSGLERLVESVSVGRPFMEAYGPLVTQ